MDLYCHRCGEPWDVYYVQHEMTRKERNKFHSGVGCPACEWGKNAPKEEPLIGMVAGALTDVLGDDVDGIAAELDDFMRMHGPEQR